MFLDEIEIYVRSGDGGHGCVSFRREKFVPKGGPDGGNGGDGGNIVFLADPNLNTLHPLAGRRHWIAENGRPGMGSNKTGRRGRDLLIRVPVGTQVYDRELGIRLKDLTHVGETVCLIPGGKGGLGNRAFATPSLHAPRFAEPGGPGSERWLRLELKLVADVGIVGLPNAGKSTLLSRLSRARPKIADYPFTTTEPQLGILELPGYRRLVLADIPGLITGAHEGVGLGDAFLRHIERTRVILHLLDAAPPQGQPSPAEAYRIVRGELSKYSPRLAEKVEVVAANKMDLTEASAGLETLRGALDCEVYPISAVAGTGLARLCEVLWAAVAQAWAVAAAPPQGEELSLVAAADRNAEPGPTTDPAAVSRESDHDRPS